MPWKEPGNKPREKPRDKPHEPYGGGPWGHGNRGGGGPDLDAWLKRARRKLGPFGHGPLGALALVVLVVVVWFLIGGWTVIGGQQVGVVLRLGRLHAVLQPGLHLRLPSPIDRVQKVDLGQARTLSDQTRLMTRDGQLALVDYFVQYKVTDARDFLFSTRDAQDAARNAAAVVVRASVGTHTLEQLQDRDDDSFGKAIAARLQAALDADRLGVQVIEAGIQSVAVPSEVKAAFDDVGKAHQDAKAAQATARADVARGKVQAQAQAASIKARAQAYRGGAAAAAEADVARFRQVLAQYQAAPEVTRHRLWLETMQQVLSKNRVIVNSGSGNVIVQFPARAASVAPPTSSVVPVSASSTAVPSSQLTSGPALQGTSP